jgi:hypothetical protein
MIMIITRNIIHKLTTVNKTHLLFATLLVAVLSMVFGSFLAYADPTTTSTATAKDPESSTVKKSSSEEPKKSNDPVKKEAKSTSIAKPESINKENPTDKNTPALKTDSSFDPLSSNPNTNDEKQTNGPIVLQPPPQEPPAKNKDVKKECDKATKDVQDTLCKLANAGDNNGTNGSGGGSGGSTGGGGGGDNNGTKPLKCGEGFHLDKKTKVCKLDKDCDQSTVGNQTIIRCDDKIVKRIDVVVHNKGSSSSSSSDSKASATTSVLPSPNNIFASSISGQGTPSILLLLDSKQLCTSTPANPINTDPMQCGSQILFSTTTLSTIYDTSTQSWGIAGTVQNTNNVDFQSKALPNVTVNALFYDAAGNQVGNMMGMKVAPQDLNTGESGSFVFNAGLNTDLHGQMPFFIVLYYSFG